MAKIPITVLSSDDLETLRQLVDRDRKRSEKNVASIAEQLFSAPEVFLARPPCGRTIPARSGTQPGSEVCCIFRLDGVDGEFDDVKKIVPIELSPGVAYRERIYNIYDLAATDGLYIPVMRTKAGEWVCVKPEEYTAPTTTTEAIDLFAPSDCSGECTWTWTDAGGWTTESSCTDATTTTAGTTTTYDGTTTTTTRCPCPDESITTTTVAATTTTTTKAPCACLYPAFCGSEDGETTKTYCSRTANENNCPVGTTTSCDCNAYTTTSPAPCGTVGCTWFHAGGWPVLPDGATGYGPSGYILMDQDCYTRLKNPPNPEVEERFDQLGGFDMGAPGRDDDGNYTGCGCLYPDLSNLCETVITDCTRAANGTGGSFWATTRPPRYVCGGSCYYLWVADPLGAFPSQWVRSSTGYGCSQRVPGVANINQSDCDCPPPSSPPDDPELCGVFVEVPCAGESDPLTCAEICDPTTTTSGTTSDCSGCKLKYVSGVWTAIEDRCGCGDCANPASSGSEGETANVGCTRTTTTIAPTTTAAPTTTTTADCCDVGECFEGFFNLVSDDCSFSDTFNLCKAPGYDSRWVYNGMIKGNPISIQYDCNSAGGSVPPCSNKWSVVASFACAGGPLTITINDDCDCSPPTPPTYSFTFPGPVTCIGCETTTTTAAPTTTTSACSGISTYWVGDAFGGWDIDPMGGGDDCITCGGTPVEPPDPSVAEFEPGIGTCV